MPSTQATPRSTTTWRIAERHQRSCFSLSKPSKSISSFSRRIRPVSIAFFTVVQSGPPKAVTRKASSNPTNVKKCGQRVQGGIDWFIDSCAVTPMGVSWLVFFHHGFQLSTPATTALIHSYCPVTVRTAKDDQVVPSCATCTAIQPHMAAADLRINLQRLHRSHIEGTAATKQNVSECPRPSIIIQGQEQNTRGCRPVRLIGSPPFFFFERIGLAKGSPSGQRVPTRPHHGV